MARGMANGEPIVSQVPTDEYREAHERIFGDRKPQRGRWVMTPDGLVPADEYVAPQDEHAQNAPIMADRIHEGTISPIDGADIGSRRKRRDHMKAYGVCDRDDFKQYLADTPARKEREREQGVTKALDQACRDLYRKGKIR